MKAISPNRKKLLLVIVALGVLNEVDNYLTQLSGEASRLAPIGNIATVNTQTKVANRSPLPLAKGLAEESDVKQAELSESIFYTRSAVAAEKEVVVEAVNVEVDFKSILKERLTINSVSKEGAIINGRFYMVGQDISSTEIFTSTGNITIPRLHNISKNLKKLSFKVDGKFINLSV